MLSLVEKAAYCGLWLVLANQEYFLATRRQGPRKVDQSDDDKLQKSKSKAMAVTKAKDKGRQGREEASKCKLQTRGQCNRQGVRSMSGLGQGKAQEAADKSSVRRKYQECKRQAIQGMIKI